MPMISTRNASECHSFKYPSFYDDSFIKRTHDCGVRDEQLKQVLCRVQMFQDSTAENSRLRKMEMSAAGATHLRNPLIILPIAIQVNNPYF